MKISTHIGRIAAGAGVVAAAVGVGVPVAGATDDGSLLSRASRHTIVQPATVNPGLVTDGTLLSRASNQATRQPSVRINSGYATDGALLTRAAEASRAAAKLYPPLRNGEGFSFRAPTGWPIIAASPNYPRLKSGQGFSFKTPVGWPVPRSTTALAHSDGFHWGDAAAGFGVGAFGAVLLGGAAFIARRRGSLVHVP